MNFSPEETLTHRKYALLEVKRAIIKSYLWLSILLFLVIAPIGVFLYIEAGEHLSPYSVSVKGYYRSDGTYVSGHKRRKSGSVERDKPYESKRFLMVILIGGTTVFLIWSTYSFSEEISGLKETGEFSRYNRYVNSVHTSNIKKLLEFADTQLSFNFNDYSTKPNSLINRLISRHQSSKLYSCRVCKRKIGHDEFHTSNLAERSPKKICLDCMKNRSHLYHNSLAYIEKFEKGLEDYQSLISNLIKQEQIDLIIDSKSITNHFCNHIRSIRLNQ